MSGDVPFQYLANGVLVLHVVVVLFVIGGLVFIVLGNSKHWPSANIPWFRVTHLAAIAVVIAEAWAGVACPLTTLETWLRVRTDSASYHGSFIEHWLQRLLYYEAPSWVFTLGYTLFGLLVLFTWWYFPPTFGRRLEGVADVTLRRRG